MCLIACFIARAPRRRRPSRRWPGLGASWRPPPLQQRRRDRPWISIGQAFGREVALLHQPAAAGIDEEAGVGGLVVVHRERERHEQRGGADGGEFGDGAGAGAADHQVGVGEGLGRVVDEGREVGLHAGRGVVGAQFVDLLGAALV
jgi:hypothetical protein